MRTMVAAAVGCALAVVAAPGGAQDFHPGADYDQAIPAPESVIGHRIGDALTPSADVARYFQALRDAAPNRVVTGEYGKTWEGRPLLWAAFSAPENIARLDEIRANARALADPRRTDAAAAQAIIARQPVIVELAYSIHGNEVSPAEAAMAAARHLLAARGDPRVAAMLQNAVVLFLPAQNPDGRDRFINGWAAAHGLAADDDPLSAERAEPWPSGRFNHYLFDLNRDFFAQTQPETRGHTQLSLEWRPQVVVDAHEMGTDETFFFPPEANPKNPLLPQAQVRARDLFGRANAAAFDRAGLPYFTRETYDAYYPGYGDNWPSYLGAVSMTYEQGSPRGVAGRRTTGETLTLREATRAHLLASLTTIETAAANRVRLLGDFRASIAGIVEEGRRAGSWLLARGQDGATADALAALLARQGVEVARADAGFTACGRSYAAGSYVIDQAQPSGRLVQVLLDPKLGLAPDFLAEQERRRAKKLPPELYDITAWSLPATFNVAAARCAARPRVGLTPVDSAVRPGPVAVTAMPVAYLVPADSNATRLLSHALQAGLKLRGTTKPFTLGGRRYPAGTLVLQRAENPADVGERLARFAAATGAEVVGVDDGWVTEGPSLGSSYTPRLIAPRVAMAWGEPTRNGTGAARWLIERGYDYPVTAIRTDRLRSADLSRYDVLILHGGGNYRQVLGSEGIANLRGWVRRGGVLVAVGGAVATVAAPDAELLDTRLETAALEKDDKKDKADAKEATVPGTRVASDAEYRDALRPDKPSPDEVPGVLARAVIDADHWLGAGVPGEVNLLVDGGDIYAPLKLDQGTNVARFKGADDLLVAGYLWDENRRQLAYKPFVMVEPVGRGQVIAFTQDPTARGFLRGLDTLYMNAVLRAPSFTEKVR